MPLPPFPDRRGTLAVRVCRFPGSPRRETGRTAAKPLSGMGKSERFRRRKRNIPCSQGIFRRRGTRYRAAGGRLSCSSSRCRISPPCQRPEGASRLLLLLRHPHLPSGTATIRYVDDDYVHIANDHSAVAADASVGRALRLTNNNFSRKSMGQTRCSGYKSAPAQV